MTKLVARAPQPEAVSPDALVIYLMYSGLVRHAGERLCNLNRLRALMRAGMPCCALVMEPQQVLLSSDLEARLDEARRGNASAVLLPTRRSAISVDRRLLQVLGERPVAAVIFTQSQAALLAWRLRRRFRAPAIWDCRGFIREREVMPRSLKQRAKDAFLVAPSEPVAARISDHVLCVSDVMRAELSRRLRVPSDAMTVVRNTSDMSVFRPDPSARTTTRRELGLDDRLVFIFCGSAMPWHCLRETADFVAAVKLRRTDAHFLVLSTSPASAQAALEKSALASKDVTLLCVAHAEVPRYLAAADIATLLISQAPGKATCCPMKFSEYVGVGLPVVISPGVGDYTGWVLDQRLGVVVNPQEQEEWPRRVADLLDLLYDPELPERCRRIACDRLDLSQDAVRLVSAIRAARTRAACRQSP